MPMVAVEDPERKPQTWDRLSEPSLDLTDATTHGENSKIHTKRTGTKMITNWNTDHWNPLRKEEDLRLLMIMQQRCIDIIGISETRKKTTRRTVLGLHDNYIMHGEWRPNRKVWSSPNSGTRTDKQD